jgi:predicted nuclease of predicted toxin-antitoxin system
MKILLDENLPKKLMRDLRNLGFSVSCVPDEGWKSLVNGALIQKMIENSFTILLTFDQNLQYQQNLSKYSITVITLHAKNNQYLTLKNLIPDLENLLRNPLEQKVYQIMEEKLI